jgi:hypothetical protein
MQQFGPFDIALEDFYCAGGGIRRGATDGPSAAAVQEVRRQDAESRGLQGGRLESRPWRAQHAAFPENMTDPVTRCIFCGASSSLTKEHVFSRWTHKYMAPRKPGRAISRVGTAYKDRDELHDARLRGQVRDWQIKCVCGGNHLTCNNGWMRDIEDQAKPILKKLIQGNQIDLNPREQRLIATWAVLKSMVSEYHHTSHVSTYWTQRRLMKNRKIPPAKDWTVWIGHFERTHWRPEWLSFPFFVPSKAVEARRGIRVPTYYNASCTTQVIGKLFIQVIHFPVPFITAEYITRRIFPSTHGTIFGIWPDQLPVISWPQKALSDLEADRLGGALQFFLRALSRTP